MGKKNKGPSGKQIRQKGRETYNNAAESADEYTNQEGQYVDPLDMYRQGGVLTEEQKAKAEDIKNTEMGVDSSQFVAPDKYTTEFDAQGWEMQNREAPRSEAAVINQAQSDEWRAKQMGLVDQLQGLKFGWDVNNSPAQLQMKMAFDQAMQNQRGMAAQSTGANRALASRTMANNVGQLQQNQAAQSALLRSQETIDRQKAINEGNQWRYGQMQDAMYGARGQDIGIAGQNASMQQQTNIANQQSELQQQAMNDAMQQWFMSQGFSRDQAALQAQIMAEQLKAQNFQATLGVTPGMANSYNPIVGGIPQIVAAGVGGLGPVVASGMQATDNNNSGGSSTSYGGGGKGTGNTGNVSTSK